MTTKSNARKADKRIEGKRSRQVLNKCYNLFGTVPRSKIRRTGQNGAIKRQVIIGKK